MDVPSWIKALRADGELFADVASNTSLDAAVPGCPEWRVRDLVGHLGRIHRWAGTVVGERIGQDAFGQLDGRMTGPQPEDDGLVEWFRAGHRDLVDTLEAAPTELACATFMPAPTPLAFWARRQAHETAVHRVDAEQAAGRPSSVDPDFAADGIDELLRGFLPRSKKLRAAEPRKLLFSSAGRYWLVTVGPEAGAVEVAEPEPADATVSGPAAVMYLALWNRVPWDQLTITGDDDLRAFWSGIFRVR
ncbi:MAG TPA: maleylpyruvate isomerase family mycothiol-dependent enzyme [Pseudonocardiaceae bacterium]